MYEYLITTNIEVLNRVRKEGQQVVMVDGTVPGFVPKKGDLHFDHHRLGGAKIQLEEILHNTAVQKDCLFVSTLLDADACVAVAYLRLITEYPQIPEWLREEYDKLAAIAYDCDHLCVPSYYYDLADFAMKAVAALKITAGEETKKWDDTYQVPKEQWTEAQKQVWNSYFFEEGVKKLVSAVRGFSLYPGENGEADGYIGKLTETANKINEKGLIAEYKGALLFDATMLEGYIDPRCWLIALNKSPVPYPNTPITLTKRIKREDKLIVGISYTLGCLPNHPLVDTLDYTQGAFAALTAAERNRDPRFLGEWGGRATVGGSSWNYPSFLYPKEVIDIVLNNI